MKTVCTLLLFFWLLPVTAQRKKFFFDDIYFSGMTGNQTYLPGLSEWKNMYKDRKTFPYLLDTMKSAYYAKCGLFINLNTKGAFAIMAAKQLVHAKSGWWANKALEWRTGLYYKQSGYNPRNSSFLYDFYYPADTTKQYVRNNVRLNQQKQILEWQHLVNFKTGSFIHNKVRFNLGSGIAISKTIKNTITENYNQTVFTWNSGAHYFNQQETAVANTVYKAKAETNFSYVFYCGTELCLSKQMSLLSDFHYTAARYKYAPYQPLIESYWLGLTFRYGLNQ
jgi:hypothetical protein